MPAVLIPCPYCIWVHNSNVVKSLWLCAGNFYDSWRWSPHVLALLVCPWRAVVFATAGTTSTCSHSCTSTIQTPTIHTLSRFPYSKLVRGNFGDCIAIACACICVWVCVRISKRLCVCVCVCARARARVCMRMMDTCTCASIFCSN